MMYLVSSYHRGAMNVGNMRLVYGLAALRRELERLRAERSAIREYTTLTDYVQQASYRVYEMKFGHPPKLVGIKKLEEMAFL